MTANKIDFKEIAAQVRSLAETDPHYLPLLSNTSALLNEALDDINWVGFYMMKNDKLVLGPFQGKPACIHIEPGKGVCGTAAKKKVTQLVDDVHEFPGHIACDAASRSEIVIPILKHSHDISSCEVPEEHRHACCHVIGVLDIDSPTLARFSEEDREGLEHVVKALESVIRY